MGIAYSANSNWTCFVPGGSRQSPFSWRGIFLPSILTRAFSDAGNAKTNPSGGEALPENVSVAPPPEGLYANEQLPK